ncbi:serine hydrolase domain-containing protein [Altererythrobacter sp. GH1-8]|uniref:serine hydrolase domain-containing protein n=1 Tax=Altererythrobacter sp. GH1-8 TaxID=3349333 RepID=UPI00374D7961
MIASAGYAEHAQNGLNRSQYTMPAGVDDPEAAIEHWSFSDPVYMWRLLNRPENPFEPAEYFYWPDAVIEGDERAFLPSTDHSALGRDTLAEMREWAKVRKSNALIVVHRGEVVLEDYWNEFTSSTLANGRAMTRSMAPLLLGFALRDGGVSLDDPIGLYIDQWRDDPRGSITVRQLAQNVSGLKLPERLPATQVLGNGFMCLTYCGDVNRAALEFPLADKPGHVFNVADQNMQILGMVIEKALGKPVEQILSERIWKPIGAADATFQRDRPGGKARIMCCMRATPRDWTRLGVLLLNDGTWNGREVVPADWIAEMAKPSQVNPNHGMGFWLGTPFDPLRTYYSGQPGVIPMSQPYLTDDVRIIEGGGFRVLYMSAEHDLVIFRHGVGVPDWDGAALVNMAVRGLQKSSNNEVSR